MSNQDEINSIERNIKEAQADKDLGSALERLQNNRDFKAVIKAAYFRDEAIRLVHLRGDPAWQTPEKQAAIILQMDAIANLAQFFLTLGFKANLAGKSIGESEAVLEDLRTEELA